MPEGRHLLKRKQQAPYRGVESRGDPDADTRRDKVPLVLGVPEPLEHASAKVHGRAMSLADGAAKSGSDVDQRALWANLKEEEGGRRWREPRPEGGGRRWREPRPEARDCSLDSHPPSLKPHTGKPEATARPQERNLTARVKMLNTCAGHPEFIPSPRKHVIVRLLESGVSPARSCTH